MSLGVDVIRTRGRAAQAVAVEVVRDLDLDDLSSLSEERGIKATPLKRLATRHHALARALASGMPDGEAALMVGMQQSTVSILKSDPAFKELMDFYIADVDRVYRDVHESLADMSFDAIELIRGRMEEEPEKVSTGQLLQIAQMGADRTGHGPQSSTTNLNLNVNVASKMEEARKRLAARQAALAEKIIEGDAS